jgi:hypothetical protein
LPWLQHPSEINGDNLKNIRREASRNFRDKKRGYSKEEINYLATNSKHKYNTQLCRGFDEFKRGYLPRSNLVKDQNGDLLADSHNMLNRWKK